jgi:protein N-terminal amidase
MNNKSSLCNLNTVMIQYSPINRNIDQNIKKIDTLLDKYTEEDKIDILLFPEMALTGYIFDNKDDVLPYLEEYNKGKTFEFCSSLAKRLKCYVFLGYPEKSDGLLYNSCMIVDKAGNALPSYRKHFLYEMDILWCIEGEDFGFMEIETHTGFLVKLGIGICMDLNPKEFKAPWEAMEFSTFCLMNNVDVILFLTNWIDSEPEKNSKKEVLSIINYWVQRLEPFLVNKIYKPVYFLAADRCGKERETNFIGCSCALKIDEKNKPTLLKFLDKKEESSIFVTCEITK